MASGIDPGWALVKNSHLERVWLTGRRGWSGGRADALPEEAKQDQSMFSAWKDIQKATDELQEFQCVECGEDREG